MAYGTPKTFSKLGDSGLTIDRSFCGACGSPLFTTAPHRPEFVWVKAGSLDQSDGVEVVDQIWTDSRVPWSVVPDLLPGHRRNRPA